MQLKTLAAALAFIGLMLSSHAQTDSLKWWMNRGEAQYDSGHFSGAEASFLRARDLAQGRNPHIYLQTLNNLGNIAGNTGKPEIAIGYFQEALRNVSLAENPPLFEAKVLKNICAIYSDLEDFGKALEYVNKATVLAETQNDRKLLADCYNNKGVVYEQIDSMPQAIDMYQRALGAYQTLNDTNRLALVNLNLGVLYKRMHNLPNAALAYNDALRYARHLQNDYYIAATLNNLGNVYSAQGKHQEAIAATKEALDLSKRIGEYDVHLNAMQSLADQYKAMGNYSLAYDYAVQYSVLRDSLINEERVRSLSEMEAKFEVEKKELMVAKLSAENDLHIANEKRNRILILLLLVLMVSLVIGTLFFLRVRSLQQKKASLELIASTEKQERERIAQDMHDELGSSISRIHWITATAERGAKHEEDKEQFKKIESITSALSVSMKSLIWVLNIGHSSEKTLAGRIREMAAQAAEDRGVSLQFNSDASLSDRTSIHQTAVRDIFLFAKEAVNNACKYAQAHCITIHIHTDEHALNISITDDGIGFDPQQVAKGNGLGNMQKRCAAHRASFHLQSTQEKGTSIHASFPLQHIRL